MKVTRKFKEKAHRPWNKTQLMKLTLVLMTFFVASRSPNAEAYFMSYEFEEMNVTQYLFSIENAVLLLG